MNDNTQMTQELQELSDMLISAQRRIANLIPALVNSNFDNYELTNISTSLTSLPRIARSLKMAADEIGRRNP